MIGYKIAQDYHVHDIGTLATVDDCLTYAREFCLSQADGCYARFWLSLDNSYEFTVEVFDRGEILLHDRFCGTTTKFVDGIGYLLSVENCKTIGHFV